MIMPDDDEDNLNWMAEENRAALKKAHEMVEELKSLDQPKVEPGNSGTRIPITQEAA